MKTFANWRNVGRAMLEARRSEGVTVARARDEQSGERVFTWATDGMIVTLSFEDGDDAYRLGVDGEDVWLTDGFFGEDTLRVLAALGLVANEIASAADERYGKCTRCGRLIQWVPQAGPFAARWCHLDPTRPYHKPVVAG
jgi:hypothetical protein